MRRHALILGALLLGTLAIYHQALSFPYVYEDWQRTAADWHFSLVPGQWLGDALWQGEPRFDHALNLLVHLLNISLVYALLVRFGAAKWAWLGAGLFAWHPIQAEAIAYASGRSELLVTACALGVLGLLTARACDWRHLVSASVLAWLACGVKQSGVVVPILAIGLVWLRYPRLTFWLLPLPLMALCGLPELIWRNHAALMAWPSWVRLESTALMQLGWTVFLPWMTTIEHDPAGEALWIQYACEVAVICLGYALIVGLVKSPHRAWWGVAWMALIVAPRFLLILPSAPLNEHHFYALMPGLALSVTTLVEAA